MSRGRGQDPDASWSGRSATDCSTTDNGGERSRDLDLLRGVLSAAGHPEAGRPERDESQDPRPSRRLRLSSRPPGRGPGATSRRAPGPSRGRAGLVADKERSAVGRIPALEVVERGRCRGGPDGDYPRLPRLKVVEEEDEVLHQRRRPLTLDGSRLADSTPGDSTTGPAREGPTVRPPLHKRFPVSGSVLDRRHGTPVVTGVGRVTE